MDNEGYGRSDKQRDHPGTAEAATIEAFADAILALDDSMRRR